MVGQLNLISKINNYTLNNLPHSILLLGEKGMGKHTLASYMSNKFNLDLIDITENVLETNANNYYINAINKFLLIDLNLITEKEQNKLLKLVEEPPLNCYLLLLSDSKSLILSTLIHRCVLFELEDYSEQELKQFTDKNINTNIFKTPGQIINFNFNTLNETIELADKIINKLNSANYPNVLIISEKFNYKDEYDKIDLTIFINTLLYKLNLYNKKEKNNLYKKYYLLTLDFNKKLINKRINKQLAIENYLTKMWKESRSEY